MGDMLACTTGAHLRHDLASCSRLKYVAHRTAEVQVHLLPTDKLIVPEHKPPRPGLEACRGDTAAPQPS